MKKLANIFRILTGLVFIFSGFVKGVDPLGFAYKIEDYFVAYHTDWAMPLALALAIFGCMVEFTIGAMLLLNFRMKFTSWVLLLMMIFFTGLTLVDAITNPVPDCGCFGNAIILTNWQTFYKNVVLIIFAIVIFAYRNKFRNSVTPLTQWLISGIIALGFAFFSTHCYRHLPPIDFTEWKIGHKLYAEKPLPVKYFLTYNNKATGEQKEYLSPNYPFNDSVWMAQWEFVSQRVEDPNTYYGKSLVITDSLGNIYTDAIIRNPGYQLIVNAFDLKTADAAAFQRIDKLCQKLSGDGVASVALVAAEPQDIAKFVADNKLTLEFFQSDDILLKTMVRSNPGLMLLKGGVVIDKWHWRDIPDYDGFKKKFLSEKEPS
jgi:uncharacterized membrane protein YphA (DoxX/SURF4 family)